MRPARRNAVDADPASLQAITQGGHGFVSANRDFRRTASLSRRLTLNVAQSADVTAIAHSSINAVNLDRATGTATPAPLPAPASAFGCSPRRSRTSRARRWRPPPSRRPTATRTITSATSASPSAAPSLTADPICSPLHARHERGLRPAGRPLRRRRACRDAPGLDHRARYGRSSPARSLNGIGIALVGLFPETDASAAPTRSARCSRSSSATRRRWSRPSPSAGSACPGCIGSQASRCRSWPPSRSPCCSARAPAAAAIARAGRDLGADQRLHDHRLGAS